MKSFMLLMLSAMLFLTGCADFHDEPGKSVWSEGGWLVFWIPFLGALWFLSLGYRGSQSPAMKNGRQIADKTPITKVWKFWLGVVLVAVSIGVVWYFNSSNWR